MRAFAGETVTLQEIRECFVRQHADRLLRPAVADPAILIQKPDPVIGVLAVNLQLVRRYLMMHRLAVEVVEYQMSLIDKAIAAPPFPYIPPSAVFRKLFHS